MLICSVYPTRKAIARSDPRKREKSFKRIAQKKGYSIATTSPPARVASAGMIGAAE